MPHHHTGSDVDSFLTDINHDIHDDPTVGDSFSNWKVISDDFSMEYSGESHFTLFAVGTESHAHEISSHFQQHHVPTRVSFSGSAGQINADSHPSEDPFTNTPSAFEQSNQLHQGWINVAISTDALDRNQLSDLSELLSSRGINGYVSRINEMGVPEYIPLKEWLP